MRITTCLVTQNYYTYGILRSGRRSFLPATADAFRTSLRAYSVPHPSLTAWQWHGGTLITPPCDEPHPSPKSLAVIHAELQTAGWMFGIKTPGSLALVYFLPFVITYNISEALFATS